MFYLVTYSVAEGYIKPNELISPVDNPATRLFRRTWLGSSSYSVAFTVMVFLTVVNVLLVGRETAYEAMDSTIQSIQRVWYYNFLLPYQSDVKCESGIYRPGAIINTNFSLFDWKLDAIVEASSQPSFGSKDHVLQDCGLERILLAVQTATSKFRVTAVVNCTIPDVGYVQLSTRLTHSFALSAKMNEMYGDNPRITWDVDREEPSPMENLDTLKTAVSEALLGPVQISAILRNWYTMTPTMFSAELQPQNSLTDAEKDPDVSFAEGTPGIALRRFMATYGDGCVFGFGIDPLEKYCDGIGAEDPALAISEYQIVVLNLAQVLLAAIRIDLGDHRHNNIFLDQSIAREVLNDPPVTGLGSLHALFLDPKFSLYNQTWYDSKRTELPLRLIPGPSTIPSVCRYMPPIPMPARKRSRSPITSVLVASLSMMGLAWCWYLFIIAIGVSLRALNWKNRCKCCAHNTNVNTSSKSAKCNSGLPAGLSEMKEWDGNMLM